MRASVKTILDSVRVGDSTIEFEVRRSRRRKKTVQVGIVEGGVRVLAPWNSARDEVRRLVLKRAQWILRHLAESERRPRLRFVTGEVVPYLGRDLTLHVRPPGHQAVGFSLEDGRLAIPAPDDLPDAVRHCALLQAVMGWFSARAAERVPQLVGRWWPLLGRGSKPRVLVRDQRSRWGSCAADGTLRFSWRVMMLEPQLVDYIVVHELAHLSVRNHSAAFWAVVSAAMPDVQARRARLREAGRTLPL